MDKLRVETSSRAYPIFFAGDFGGLKQALREENILGDHAFVVSDSNVAPLYLKSVEKELSPLFTQVTHYVFPAGEESKNLGQTEALYQAFLQTGLGRKSVVFALGGGVTGDLAGFASGTFMRGISYVQIPTTLLAQVDSSVGGKTGVDLDGYKNVVGVFHQPCLVYVNVAVLDTLPHEQFLSGLAEAIKHGCIQDRSYFDLIRDKREAILHKEQAVLKQLIKRSCEIKADVVGKDEKETGLREILNFGHTFGHGVETLCQFTLPHGHCVSIGMVAALGLSRDYGWVGQTDYDMVLDLLINLGLPVKVEGITAQHLLEAMEKDKKNRDGRIRVVLLEAFGQGVPGKSIPANELLRAMDSIIEEETVGG